MSKSNRPADKVAKAGAIRPPKAVEMDARRRLLEMAEKAQMDALSVVRAIENGNIGAIQAADALEDLLRRYS